MYWAIFGPTVCEIDEQPAAQVIGFLQQSQGRGRVSTVAMHRVISFVCEERAVWRRQPEGRRIETRKSSRRSIRFGRYRRGSRSSW